jgi:integrase
MIAVVIEPIVTRGAVESAKKILWHVERVFSFAKAKGLVDSNPAVDVAEILPRRVKRTRRPALLELDALRDVLRRSDLAPLSPGVRLALRLCAFAAARAGNVVAAEWSELHLDDNPPQWVIPRHRMKRRDDRSHDHRVMSRADDRGAPAQLAPNDRLRPIRIPVVVGHSEVPRCRSAGSGVRTHTWPLRQA